MNLLDWTPFAAKSFILHNDDYSDSNNNVLKSYNHVVRPKLTKLEMQIMDIFWNRGAACVREIQEAFPEDRRPAYTTVQSTVYRLERKKALRIVKRISKANIFEAAVSRDDAQRGLIDEFLALSGGRARFVMAHLIESRQLTRDDIEEARKDLRKLARKDGSK